MREAVGDIFSFTEADVICFTSNGVVKRDGELVMGAGIALAFKNKWPSLPLSYGRLVQRSGNHCCSVDVVHQGRACTVVSFPTKHHYSNPSDIELIKRSAHEIVELANFWGYKNVYMTRPGCGLGGLDWEKDVKPVISQILDDRFVIVTPGKKQ